MARQWQADEGYVLESSSRQWTAGGLYLNEASGLTYDQSAYRWRNDDGSESGATWQAAENTGVSVNTLTNIRLRVQTNTGGGDPASEAVRLEYRKVGDPTWLVV